MAYVHLAGWGTPDKSMGAPTRSDGSEYADAPRPIDVAAPATTGILYLIAVYAAMRATTVVAGEEPSVFYAVGASAVVHVVVGAVMARRSALALPLLVVAIGAVTGGLGIVLWYVALPGIAGIAGGLTLRSLIKGEPNVLVRRVEPGEPHSS